MAREKIKSIVRIANTDLNGEERLLNALRGIKGISFTMAKAICEASGIGSEKKLGELSEDEINKLERVIKNPKEYGIPSFLLNRRRDPESGKDLHLAGADVKTAMKFDIEKEIKLRTYRGWRHMLGQPVRGQKTRSHFRHGRTIGVIRKAVRLQMQKKKGE